MRVSREHRFGKANSGLLSGSDNDGKQGIAQAGKNGYNNRNLLYSVNEVMARKHYLKAVNRSSILNAVRTHGPIARADIARRTGLSPATVTGQTAELIQDGLIFEKQEGDSRGGRRPVLLALVEDGIFVAGIKLAEDRASLAITDLNAEVIANQEIPLAQRDPVTVSQQLVQALRDVMAVHHLPFSRLLGLGVGLAGIIDSANGICRLSPFNDWRDVPFAEYLEEGLERPVYLDNDVNTLTLMEKLYGLGQHTNNFLVVTIGRGVGLGIVIDGKIYRGAHGGAGELGHTVIDPAVLDARSGSHGSLETFVAEPWLLKRAQSQGLKVQSVEDFVQLGTQGDPLVQALLEQAGEVLGQALANLVNLFDPALIILSGEGVRLGEDLFMPMRAALQRYSFADMFDHIELRIEPLSDVAWARGAASLVLGRVFHTPEPSHIELVNM